MTETAAWPPAAAPAALWRSLGAALARAGAMAAAPGTPLLLSAQGVWALSGTPVLHESFATWCALHPGQACTLWAGADVLVDLLADNEPALRAPAARTAWARRVLQHYHGDDAQTWPLWPWLLHGAAGTSALRGAALAALRADATAQGVTLRAVLPLWPQLLRGALAEVVRPQDHHCCWLVEAPLAAPATATPVLTQVQLQRGRITGLQRRRLQGPVGAALQGLLDEAAQPSAHTLLWWGAPPWPDDTWPVELRPAQVLPDGGRLALPAQPAPGDFLQPEPRASALAWLWLATCASVLAVAALEAHGAWQQRAEAQTPGAHSASLVAAREGAVPSSPVPPASAADGTGPALQDLQARRGHPWAAAFGATELPAVAGLRWLAMEHGATGELRLQGLAKDPDSVHRAAAALRLQPLWRHVLVARLEAHEAVAAGAGPAPAGSPLSFEIVARLRAPAP